jgi:hypothetical protein
MAESLARPRPVTGTPEGALERYRRQFPQWSIQPVVKGDGYTAHTGPRRQWGPDLLSMALAMAAATGTLRDVAAAAPFPGRPGYVAADCGHPIAAGEWQVGFRTCSSCTPPPGQ